MEDSDPPDSIKKDLIRSIDEVLNDNPGLPCLQKTGVLTTLKQQIDLELEKTEFEYQDCRVTNNHIDFLNGRREMIEGQLAQERDLRAYAL